jgi:hypothetical protein
MEKILISGTGRCGTTFLIKLFTFCNLDTGFTRDNYAASVFENCNSGMELPITSQHYILKNRAFISDIKDIANTINIKHMIIPIRNFEESAKSRVKNGYACGGLWGSNDLESQINFYNKIMANYVFYMVKYSINTIFIDFDRMITDSEYLYELLKPILIAHNVDIDTYNNAYSISNDTSKPKS